MPTLYTLFGGGVGNPWAVFASEVNECERSAAISSFSFSVIPGSDRGSSLLTVGAASSRDDMKIRI